MKVLKIYAEEDLLVAATEEVLKLLKEGYTSGIDPDWDILEEEP